MAAARHDNHGQSIIKTVATSFLRQQDDNIMRLLGATNLQIISGLLPLEI